MAPLPHRLATALALVILSGATASLAAGRLSPAERRMVTSVDRHAPAALGLLERAVNINSGTMNFAGVRATADLLAPEFRSLGFETRWVEGAPWGRAGHLIATRLRPHAGARVLLIGHLDTVFERDSPFQRFQRTSDSTAAGPGVTDMKGGDVIMLLALRALADAGRLDRLSVSVMLSGDEESAGSPLVLARADLVALADSADAAIGFEDGDDVLDHVVIARRSAGKWVLRTGGQPAHSGQIFQPDIGHGAVYEAARILHAFEDSLGHEPYLTLNPGVIVGGTEAALDTVTHRGSAFGKDNVVAGSAVATGDLRTLTPEQRERAWATMRRIVAASPAHASASITFDVGYPPLAPTDGNRRLLAAVDRASRDLGQGPVTPVDPARAGAADVSFVAGHTPMVIDAMGLKGDGGHTTGEYAWLPTLEVQAKRTAVVLSRLSEPAGGR